MSDLSRRDLLRGAWRPRTGISAAADDELSMARRVARAFVRVYYEDQDPARASRLCVGDALARLASEACLAGEHPISQSPNVTVTEGVAQVEGSSIAFPFALAVRAAAGAAFTRTCRLGLERMAEGWRVARILEA